MKPSHPHRRWASNTALQAMLLSATITVSAAPATKLVNWADSDILPGRLIIQYKPEAAARLRAGASPRSRGVLHRPIDEPLEQRLKAARPNANFTRLLPDHYVGTFEPANRARIVQELGNDPDVVFFEPDRVRQNRPTWGTIAPNDPDYTNGFLWGMIRIGASNAWARQSATRSTIRIGVMEADDTTVCANCSGIDFAHADLGAQQSPAQINFSPAGNHATHVAGTIAATGNDGRGVIGVANIELVSMTAGNKISDFATQIAWALNNGVRVINMSFSTVGSCATGYPAASVTEQDAINNAATQIVFIAAASNEACNRDANGNAPTPVSYDNVVGVSALDRPDGLAWFSNFGNYVDLTAPGTGIRSTIRGGGYEWSQGTSMAAPHVAGAAAAVLAIHPNFDTASLRRLLYLTAEDIGPSGRDDYFGNGVVRADRAVNGIADLYTETVVNPFIADGTLFLPYRFSTAIDQIPSGGTVGLVRTTGTDTYSAPENISKPCTLIAVGGTATISR